MAIRGRLAFDDQGRLVEISETAADPSNPQPSEIEPVEFDQVIINQLAGALDAGGNSISNVDAFDANSIDTDQADINNILLRQKRHTLTSGSKAQLFDFSAHPGGTLHALTTTDNPAILTLNGSGGPATEQHDPGGAFSTTEGNPTWNIYWDTTNSRYEIENGFASTGTVDLFLIGF